ncbi:unnamed protein product [Linum tenue]|uniref:Uncharacterized protein n=1 Tax=Linum tenue TaxID=586396 RepID=A0AAV0RMR6_9ROSI|nr:unnamed protein product [Linum tenue]
MKIRAKRLVVLCVPIVI